LVAMATSLDQKEKNQINKLRSNTLTPAKHIAHSLGRHAKQTKLLKQNSVWVRCSSCQQTNSVVKGIILPKHLVTAAIKTSPPKVIWEECIATPTS